jgi:hypothetical protein
MVASEDAMTCPKCKTKIAWFEQPKVRLERREIHDGDNFVCAECKTVSIVENGQLRMMTAGELLKRPAESRAIIEELVKAVK